MNAVAEQQEELFEAQEAVSEEPEATVIDVDLGEDSEFSMEWEVETEPAPGPAYAPASDPVYEETYYGYEEPQVAVRRSINKHVYTWLCSFYLGIFGVDRFCRGQIVLGMLKMLTFGGLGFWYVADWIIALVKSYGENRYTEDLLFDRFGNFIN